MFTITAIIGVLTVIAGIAVKLVGFPDQIRQNHRRRSTEGLSTTFMLMTFLAYSLWTSYGLQKGDWVVTLGQGVGVLTSAVILYQIAKYQGQKPRR